MSKEDASQKFHWSIKLVLESWKQIEEKMDIFREEIANDFFTQYPQRMDLFRHAIGLVEERGATEENLRKKLYKHSVAVINCMEAVVDFFKGNEESKPILFVLGKQHKRLFVSEKMFLEMKTSICRIIEKRLDDKCSRSWKMILEYIYSNYVFPGMSMFAKGSCTRLYSVYSPVFKEPISDPKEFKKLIETEHIENLKAWKIKAAKNSRSCVIYYHPDVELFTNYVMTQGKKQVATQNVRDAFTRIKHVQLRKYQRETDEEKKKHILLKPLDVFLLAVKNATPLLWFFKVRKSGSWYKVPTGISEERGRRLAMKWLVEAANDKASDIRFSFQLANEILDAAEYKGKTVNKKIEVHKLCEANRGYAHYWWA